MTTINQELYEALIAAGAPDDVAKRAAATVYDKDQIATKLDLRELEQRLAGIEGKLTVLIGLNIAMALAVIGPYLARLFP